MPSSHPKVRVALAAAVALVVAPLPAGEAPTVTFAHAMADFTGTVRLGEARVAFDPIAGEVLVAEGRDVRVFNGFGMQVYGFRTSTALGGILDLEVEPDGDVVTMALDLEAAGSFPRVVVTRHDFRGVPKGEIRITGVEAPFDRIVPNRIVRRDDGFILAHTTRWLAMKVGEEGAFERGWDIARLVGIPDEDRDTQEMNGFSVDRDGNLLVTCAVLFRAWVISPGGDVVGTWGDPGSVEGTFGIVGGIARDAKGRFYVADKNRGVVMIFDEGYRFLAEFGQERHEEGVLALPGNVYVDDRGHVYVTQIGRRGLWVYNLREK